MNPTHHALRRSFAVFLLSILTNAAAAPPVNPPSIAPEIADRLARYQQGRDAQFVDFSGEGVLVRTRFGEHAQIHRVAQPLGLREQLTWAAEDVLDARRRPGADEALVLQGGPDGENATLLIDHPAEHRAMALGDGTHHDSAARWSHDGRQIAFASDRRNGADWDIYTLDTSLGLPLPHFVTGSAGERWRVLDWSADDGRLLLARLAARAPERGGTGLFVAELPSGRLTPVLTAGGAGSAAGPPLTVWAAHFDGDGHAIVLASERSEPPAARAARHLSVLGATGQWADLTSGTAAIDLFALSPDGHYVAYTNVEGGVSHLSISDRSRRIEAPVPGLPAGRITALRFDASGHRLALTVETVRAPADVYVYDTEAHTLVRWTRSEPGPVDPASWIEPIAVRVPAWNHADGGGDLPVLLYRPGGNPATAHPVVLLLCAASAATGDGGQSAPDAGQAIGLGCQAGYSPFIQFLVNELGFAVAAAPLGGPDAGALVGSARDDSVRDVGALLAWLGAQPGIDRSRVALMGADLGGYLALESLSQYGQRLRAAVALDPAQLARLVAAGAIRSPVFLGVGSAPAWAAEQVRDRLRGAQVEVQWQAGAGGAVQQAAIASFLAAHLR